VQQQSANQGSAISSSMPVIAAVDLTDPQATSETKQDFPSIVASVVARVPERRRFSKYRVTVSKINDIPCDLDALVDSGSAVTMIKLTTFNSIFNSDFSFVKLPVIRPSTIHDQVIKIVGFFFATIHFKDYPNLIATKNYYSNFW